MQLSKQKENIFIPSKHKLNFIDRDTLQVKSNSLRFQLVLVSSGGAGRGCFSHRSKQAVLREHQAH